MSIKCFQETTGHGTSVITDKINCLGKRYQNTVLRILEKKVTLGVEGRHHLHKELGKNLPVGGTVDYL